MKTILQVIGMLAAAVIFGVAANPAVAQPGPGGGPGYGRGPGATGEYGGPGNGPGYGRGPGMMGDYGGPGYGRGPRGGGGGYGPGMMWGEGGYGAGPGMMGGGNFAGLNLSADQKAKVTPIQRDTRRKMWALMGKMMESQYALQDLYDADKQDAAAINKQYKEIEDVRKQLVDTSVDAHNRINEILTKEQREQVREGGRGYGNGPMRRGY